MQKLYKDFVKGFAAQLAGYGFERGKVNVFRRRSPEGDFLVVELQGSSCSTPKAKIFYIEIGLVLAPKWERDRQKFGRPPTELPRHFHGTWRRRIGADHHSGGDQWQITDEASALQVSDHVRQRLDETLPQLLRLWTGRFC